MGIKEYFAKRKEKMERRKEIESIREHGMEYGIKPGSVLEDEKNGKWIYGGVCQFYKNWECPYYVALDKDDFPITGVRTIDPSGVIKGKKIGFYTPSHWKRHLEARQEAAA